MVSLQRASTAGRSRHASQAGAGTVPRHESMGILGDATVLSPARSKPRPVLGRSGLGRSPAQPEELAPTQNHKDESDETTRRNPMTPDTDRSTSRFSSSLAQETTARAIAAARMAS